MSSAIHALHTHNTHYAYAMRVLISSSNSRNAPEQILVFIKSYKLTSVGGVRVSERGSGKCKEFLPLTPLLSLAFMSAIAAIQPASPLLRHSCQL